MKKSIAMIMIILGIGAMPLFADETGEEEEKEPAWVGSLGLSWVATSGNSDTSSVGLNFDLERKPEPWGLLFVARGNKAQDSGTTTAENYLFSARAVRKLSERWEAFGGLAWAKDPFTGYDSQTVASLGATYIAIDGERNKLAFDGGLAYTWEDQVNPDATVDYLGGLFGLTWELKLGEKSKLVERLVFLPNFDNSTDWRLTSFTAIEADVNSWMALRFGYDIRHRNLPIGDADKTDTTSTASVVFKF
jgi:putative salt-induced outer membrane protein